MRPPEKEQLTDIFPGDSAMARLYATAGLA